ncbi:MAG: hypothetical protein R2854_10845 [Caldilineaceae bacterium]
MSYWRASKPWRGAGAGSKDIGVLYREEEGGRGQRAQGAHGRHR